ncbi:MAG: lysophospholipid acyltransferase family protein [Myxococcota bacterium]|nr:lysophospholipid acyltransferase family protein [Myxococcota bacterium]
MAFSPAIADAFAALFLDASSQSRIADLHFQDAGHGFDAFGMHPSFVALGEVVLAPLYDKYFRVRSWGHENIPSQGPAVLAANHSGNIPIDGMMLWLDVLRHTQPPRVARPIADHFVPSLPYLGTFFARGGMVGGSRGNARTLLNSGEMLMIFPEGVPGIVKPWSKRYQLQKFREGHAELAIRHQAPIVPIGVVGGEEQLPALFSSRRIGKLFGLPIMPVPAVPIPLPVRYHLYYGEPIPVHEEFKPEHADDPQAVKEVAARVQEAVQRLVHQGLSERTGIFE